MGHLETVTQLAQMTLQGEDLVNIGLTNTTGLTMLSAIFFHLVTKQTTFNHVNTHNNVCPDLWSAPTQIVMHCHMYPK
jgi:hypothetical protein